MVIVSTERNRQVIPLLKKTSFTEHADLIQLPVGWFQTSFFSHPLPHHNNRIFRLAVERREQRCKNLKMAKFITENQMINGLVTIDSFRCYAAGAVAPGTWEDCVALVSSTDDR